MGNEVKYKLGQPHPVIYSVSACQAIFPTTLNTSSSPSGLILLHEHAPAHVCSMVPGRANSLICRIQKEYLVSSFFNVSS